MSHSLLAISGQCRCSQGRSHAGAALTAFLFVLAGTAALAGQLDELKILKVKAAYLYNFPKFIEWPASAFADADSPFVIGVVGADPFGAILDGTVQSKKILSRSIEIRRFQTADASIRPALEACQVLFISASEETKLSEILSWLRDSPVLLVSDIDSFGDSGGMIGLVLEDGHIVYEVNRKALERAGLYAHSELLNLARRVDGRSRSIHDVEAAVPQN